MSETDEILTGALSRLPREKMPPAALEEATVAKLRAAGVLSANVKAPMRPASSLSLATWVLAASIAAIAVVGGSVYRSARVNAVEPLFALTVYAAGAADDSATRVRRSDEIEQWALSVKAAPEQKGSALPAVDYGSDSVIVDEEPGTSVEIVRKFYLSAPTKDSAVSIARNCPSLKYGGRVVVQPVLTKKP
jgi:hypothetical protein